MDTKIIAIKQETPTVTSFILEKPPGFSYIAGQYINIAIPCASADNRGAKRNCSLASAPYEDTLLLSFRHGISTFKKSIETLTVGTPLTFIGPFGRFVINEDTSTAAVFLTGGIGITPFYAMMKDITRKQIPKKMTVLYSNKIAADVPFKNELEYLDEINPHVAIHYNFTQETTGKRIDLEMIKDLVPNYMECEYYMCGIPKMTLDFKKMLEEIGITKERIHFEVFTGY